MNCDSGGVALGQWRQYLGIHYSVIMRVTTLTDMCFPWIFLYFSTLCFVILLCNSTVLKTTACIRTSCKYSTWVNTNEKLTACLTRLSVFCTAVVWCWLSSGIFVGGLFVFRYLTKRFNLFERLHVGYPNSGALTMNK